MKLMIASLAGMILGTSATMAADPDQTSPYDKNPRCTERTVDGNAPECIIQDEGEPRQTYPSKAKPTPPAPPTQPTPSAPPRSVPQSPRPGASR